MIIYSIYKIVNQINGKVYIGFTSKEHHRFTTHQKVTKNSKHSKRLLYFAVKKYGWENFEFTIIYQSLDEEYCLTTMEPFFINEYNSFNSGYNMTKGGEGRVGFKHSEETKYKIGSRTRGTNLSEEHKQKISKSHIGIKPPAATRALMSKNRKGKNWYTNGISNKQSKIYPGEGWYKGRTL
jgi:group I intron endonuclease